MSYVYYSNWYDLNGGSPDHFKLKRALEQFYEAFKATMPHKDDGHPNEFFFRYLEEHYGIADVKNEGSLLRSVVTFRSEEDFMWFEMKYL